MAVSEQIPYQEFIANGTTTVFPLNFDAKEQDHLIVLVDDVEPQVGEWSFDFNTDQVTFLKAPKANSVIKIRRDTPFKRDSNYQTYNNSFRPEPVNEDLDSIWYKLQEMGVLNWMINNDIKDLGAYVDSLNDETKAAFLAMIEKQGVSMQQLDLYVQGLYKKLASVAVEKGWLAEFIAYGEVNQKQVNDGCGCIQDLLNIERPQHGMRVNLRSYNPVNYALATPYFAKGGDDFVYDASKAHINDGGHIINGWCRQNIIEYNVHNFGAYGDWDGSSQSGHNDTVAIQNCFNACLMTEQNFRSGGKRTIIFNSGNYYFTKLNIHRTNWFDLTVSGHGQVQFWIKGVGNKDGGIINNLESTKWKNITFNGFEGAAGVYPPIFGVNDLQYVMQCYLPAPYTLPDIDITFDGCSVHWCKEFALIRGRGFTFRNGNWGGIQGALCVIDCDPSLIFETSNTNAMNQWFDTGMRHYRVLSSRGDGSQFVIRVQGDAACKDYIHDIAIQNCAIVNNEYGIVYAPNARLIAPKIQNSFFTMCKRGFHCKSVVNAIDSGNTWTNNAGTNVSHYSATNVNNGFQNLHIITESVDGFFIGGIGATYKQVCYSLLLLAGSNCVVKNVKIKDAFFEDFGDVSNNVACLIKFENPPLEFKNIEIKNNIIKSKNGQMKKWTSHPVTFDYTNDENSTDGNFQDHEYVWVKSSTTSGITYNYKYTQEGDYVVGIVIVSINPTVSTGAIGNIPLPIPAIPFNSSLSSQISSTAHFGYFDNLKTSKFLSAHITVSGGITLFNVTDAANLDVAHFTKLNISNVSTMSLSYRYRFKQ